MEPHTEIGEFLKSRRSRITPDEVGLPPFGGRRRTPGLRREEVAQLAGVSTDYYTRMEQGRGSNVSDGVLDGVAAALKLEPAERDHLRNLAHPVRGRRRTTRPQRVRPQTQILLDSMQLCPAIVLGRCMDVLAWNRLACALIVDFATLQPRERNIPRLVFLDSASCDLYPDWEVVARDIVAYLRLDAGRHPDDPALASLVGELSVKSERFRRWWADHNVKVKTHGTKRFRHPLTGPLTLAYETLRSADDPEQSLVVYSADPGSESDTMLRLLASWETEHVPSPDGHRQLRGLSHTSRSG